MSSSANGTPDSARSARSSEAESPAGRRESRDSPRFLVDCMLGSLARWLRILDYDTEYVRASDDDQLIAWSNAEGRVLLTKDRRLAKRRTLHHVLLIRGETLGAQIREVLAFTGDDPRRRPLFRRCLECNQVLREIPAAEAAPEVPPYVLQTQRRFLRCPRCRKIYWAGTHRSHMLERLRRLLADPEPKRG